jgi:type IV pilus assembly protein PilM
MSWLPSWLAFPPPDAAIEISPEGVSLATLGSRGREPVVQGYAMTPLHPGAVVPSLTGHNVVDRAAVVEAIRAVCDRAGTRPRRAALVIPDLAVRVSIVRFDSVPSKAEDLEQLIRWQVKKSSPFPIDDARVSYTLGQRGEHGQEFVVLVARREVIAEYEAVCTEVGIHPGVVDVSTLSVVNLVLGGSRPPDGDWLVVHMRPDYTSLAIMRGAHLVFFRNRTEGEEDQLADVVHQTTMYYQDRLDGKGFGRVLLGGAGREPGEAARLAADLEGRLAVRVEPIEAARATALTERIGGGPEVGAAVAPLVGILLRASYEGAR